MNKNKTCFFLFTLIELLLVISLLAALSALALPALNRARQRALEEKAIIELRQMVQSIELYKIKNRTEYPQFIEQFVKGTPFLDPWGNPYVYNHFSTIPPGHQRKDRNLVPINTVFDLFSKGPDGDSAPALTAESSRDDVIVAQDGEFIGLARDY